MGSSLSSGLARGALATVLLLAPAVRADAPPEDRAAADALFRDGRALVKQGKFAEGCAKLAASQKLDPAAGSLLALGDCYEQNGQTASAWTTFNEARALARKNSDGARADEAERRANLLDPKLPKLTIVLPEGAPVPGLEVRRNGKVVDASLFGSAIPVDPGPQSIEVTAPGKLPWRSTITVEPKPGVSNVAVPALAADPNAAPSAVPTASASPSGAPVASPPVSYWGTQRILGAAASGVGVAVVVVGAVFGGLTLSKVGDVNSKKLCVAGTPYRCTAEGLRLQSEANDTANISNIAFAAGGAALIAGVVVYLTAPSAPPATPAKTGTLRLRVDPAFGPETAGLSVRGAW